MIDGYRIIDGHVHTFSSEEVSQKIRESFNRLYSIEFENPGSGTIKDVLDKMKKAGVDFTIMANFAPPRIVHDNNLWTINAARKEKRLIALVSFHPEMDGDMVGLLGQYVELGAKGVKLHPMAQGFSPLDRRLEPLYTECNELRLPVVFHCGRVANARLNGYSDLETIRPLLGKYRRIPFILTHMADGNVGDVLATAGEFENVSFDTSIVITGYPPILSTNAASWPDDGEVADIINRVGADRVMFGSDYPWGSQVHDVPRILNLELDPGQKRRILSENAARIFKLEIR